MKRKILITVLALTISLSSVACNNSSTDATTETTTTQVRKSTELEPPISEIEQASELEQPSETEQPSDSKQLDSTESSNDSKQPNKTESSNDSKQPDKTESSSDSKQPDKTESSNDSKQPDKTESSDDSKQPDKTESSDDSKQTDNTESSDDSTMRPVASAYDTQFTDYIKSGNYYLMVTDGMVDSLTPNSLIYILNAQGEYLAINNQNADGSIAHQSMTSFVFGEDIIAIAKISDNQYRLLTADGAYFNNEIYKSIKKSNDVLILEKATSSGSTYSFYDSQLHLIRDNYTELDAISSYKSFGENHVIQGKAKGTNTTATFIHDSKWSCLDYIENQYIRYAIHETLIWTGTELRDQSYNPVTPPIPSWINPNGEQVIVTGIETALLGDDYCGIYVNVVDESGNISTGYFIIDGDFNTYKSEEDIEDFLWVEGYGITVMMDPFWAERYLIWNDTKEVICTMCDWYDMVIKTYGETGQVYGLAGDLYSDGSVLAWVGATYNGGDYKGTTFLLTPEDNYSIDKAINLGSEIFYKNGIYYSYDTQEIYLNRTFIPCHRLLTYADTTYYVLENTDGSYTVYDSDHTAYFTTNENLVDALSPQHFISVSESNGTTYYQLIQK